jgi:hypothetical protein
VYRVRWRSLEYTLPGFQATGTQTYLYNDTNGNLSWEDPALTPSDERLKSNITDLDTDVLSKLIQLRTVTYTLNSDDTHRTQVGFLAQDMQQYFPELVGTKSDGYLGVYYAQVTPVLVEGLKELNLKITDIENFATAENKTFVNNLIAWLGDAANGIGDLFSKTSHTETLCVGSNGDETCITKTELDKLISNESVSSSSGSDSTPTPDPSPVPDPAPSLDPTPTPDPTPDSTPATDPGPVVDPQSDPAPAPDPSLVPAPVPTEQI